MCNLFLGDGHEWWHMSRAPLPPWFVKQHMILKEYGSDMFVAFIQNFGVRHTRRYVLCHLQMVGGVTYSRACKLGIAELEYHVDIMLIIMRATHSGGSRMREL